MFNKISFLLLSFFTVSFAVAADTKPQTEDLSPRARHYLESVLDPEWKDSTIVESCGKSKLTNDRYDVVCYYDVTSKTMSTSFAVLIDKENQLVGVLRAKKYGTGKNKKYSFQVKDPIGFSDFKKIEKKKVHHE